MDNEDAIQRVYDESAERIRSAGSAFHRYSFLAIDGIEVGCGNRIPLWLFGFLY